MRSYLIEKYLTDGKKKKAKWAKKQEVAKKRVATAKKGGYSSAVAKGGFVDEASGAGGSSEFSFGYNRALLIYVQEDEVLFSYNHEFPTGSIMDDDTRQRARSRGYTLLDV